MLRCLIGHNYQVQEYTDYDIDRESGFGKCRIVLYCKSCGKVKKEVVYSEKKQTRRYRNETE